MKIPLKHCFRGVDKSVLTSNNLPHLEGDALVAAEAVALERKEKFQNGIPLTMRDVLIVALTTEFPEDQKDHANIVNEKIKRFGLFQDVQDTDKDTVEMEMTTENATYLKPRVAKCFAMLVAGPALKLLDGKAT